MPLALTPFSTQRVNHNTWTHQQSERKRAHHSKGIFKLKLKREGRRGGLEREVREWGPEEVAAWLETLHLAEYQESFITHDIRGSELLNLERRYSSILLSLLLFFTLPNNKAFYVLYKETPLFLLLILHQ